MNYKASEISNNFLISFYLNGKNAHVINNTSWKKYKACNKNLERNSTYIIETEINHWVTVIIAENRLFYMQNGECEICLSNNVIIQFAKENNLDIVPKERNTEAIDCLIYPLLFTWQMLSDDYSMHPTKVKIDLRSFYDFRDKFNNCKSQFEKIKGKIKVCTNLFSEIKDEVSVITDYKHALYFIYFVESIALQDVGLKNEELKRYIIQTTINEKNVEIVKKIRFWLLHRDKSYFVFPQQLHKFTFQEKDSRKIFEDLEKYLQYVYHKLCGEEEDEPEKKPFSILCHSEDFGNKLEKENVGHILENLSCEFIKEGFSLKKSKNPEKTLFNFIANFIPLLRLIYKIGGETFKPLIDFRNQFIHNIYILYQNGQEVPYIAFQNQLYKTKELLLKFHFCSKVTRELESISNTDGPEKSTGKVNKCLQRFKNLFSEELKSPTEKDSLENEEKAINYLIEKIEQYFRSIFMIDTFNTITLSNIKIERFNLPLNYKRFSEENKNFMFKNFNAIKTINESAKLSEDVRKHIDEIIKYDLKSLGLSESEYENIRSSVLNTQYFDNEKLVKEICKHISNIKELKLRSKFDMITITRDYYMYLENNPKFSFEKYKEITLEQFTEIEFKINIINGSFYMPLSNILKNFIPLYFNISPNYTCFESVESIFQDQEVLHIISCSNQDMKITWIDSLFLAPLIVEMMCSQKLMLGIDQERDFVVRLVQSLLESECSNKFLGKLIDLKMKDRKSMEDYFDSILKMDLIRKRPEKLNIFFSINVFQDILLNILKCDPFPKERILLMIDFLRYQYEKTIDLFQQKNYKEALELVNRKHVGLSPFLKKVVDKGILQDEILIFNIKYLIGQITLQNGIDLREKDIEGSRKHFENSLKILESLLSNLLISNFNKHVNVRWELRIKLLRARSYHFLGTCEESCNDYRYIFLKLYNMCDSLDFGEGKELYLDEFGFINPKNDIKMGKKIRSLRRFKRYKFAIELDKGILNIAQILRYYCSELYCRMRQLSKNQDIFDECTGAIESCKYVIGIQRQILRKDSYIIKKTALTVTKLYRLLRKYKKVTDAKPIVKKTTYRKKRKRKFMNLRRPIKK